MRTFLLWISAAAVAGAQSFTSELWTGARPIYERTLKHPFLTGLTDGTLPRSRFEFYLAQDAQYLQAFAQALSVLASKAPRPEWAATLNRHAVESIETERELHRKILGSIPAAEPAPVNYAYTNHLLATVFRQPFSHGLAAMLPCYWIYWEVGKELKKKGSKNADYQRWIDQYSDPGYGKTVRLVLDMMDAEAARLDPRARQELKALFRLSARYEWMFWDMAWREEKWLP
ncbi:MAG: thiaminase II [Acidobacteria bacterium]|nr:thiaminase II [Acidobacteriota bacterium]